MSRQLLEAFGHKMKIINPYRFASGGSFVPSDVSGLLLWLDSVDTSTLWQESTRSTQVSSDSDPVGAWDDKSGNDNHWSISTSTQRPTYKTNFNTSYPAVLFGAGSGDSLTGSMSESAQDYTIFVAASVSVTQTASASEYIFDFATGRFILGYDTGDAGGFGWYDGSWHHDTADPLAAGNYIITFKANSGGGGVVLANRTTVHSGTYTQKALGGAQNLGARNATNTFQWNGHIASLLIYSGNLSAGDITDVEDYLSSRYGITLP